MKKHHIATIEVTTKKNTSQTTRWVITQNIPHPSLSGSYSCISWQNDEKLLSNKENPKLAETYECYLLRSDIDPDSYEFTGNRNDHAGFSPGLVYDHETGSRVMTPARPGSIVFRGSSLGETTIAFGNNPDWPEINVRDYGHRPTGCEREFINDQIVQPLREFIKAHKASLRADAVARLKSKVAERIDKAKLELKRAEDQMLAVLAKL